MSLNTITLQGRMTKDPDYRMTQSETAITRFTLAVDRDYVPTGEQRGCDFIDCVAFGKTADFAHGNFTKGQQAIVTGRLQLREWTDKDGGKRRQAEVVADRLYFCGGKKETGFKEIEDGDLPFA